MDFTSSLLCYDGEIKGFLCHIYPRRYLYCLLAVSVVAIEGLFGNR